MTQQLRKLLILAVFFISSGALLQAQIYVNATASGANDGSSWADAYTDLNDALASAAAGDQVWVAAGTYVPGTDPDNSFYNLSDGVELYGGFNGTEAALGDRDVAANETILSGDVNGDDVIGDFNTNRGDNISTIVFADTTITASTRLDGFTLSGGDGLFADDFDQLFLSSGAAVLAQGPLQIANCNFTDNKSGRGGALSYRTGDITGFSVENCTFDGNLARTGGAVYLAGASGGHFADCQFLNNVVEPDVDSAGALLGGFGAGVLQISVIDTFINCTFSGNSNLQRVGGGMFTQDAFVVVDNCTFDSNEANDGGGIYITSVDEEIECFISNSTFTNNFAGRLGGASCVAGGTIGWDNCTFEDNEAPSGGGAFFFFEGIVNVIQNSNFARNISDFGGVMRSQGDESIWIDNEYQGNIGNSAGAALCFTFEATGEILGGTFFENNGDFGGAVFTGFGADGPVPVSLSQVTFRENTAGSSGGAIQAQNISNLTVDSCIFEANVAEALGGAINASGDSLDLGTTVIDKSTFLANVGNQGAAVNNISNRMDITNSLFAYNETGEDGIGGAFSENMASFATPQAVSLTNNTFAFNTAQTGANVSQWQTPEEPNIISTMTMQNNILASPILGPNYQIEVAGIEPELISNGGNVLTDASLGAAATADDLQDVADLAFMSAFEFQIMPESPAVDAGINDNAPLVDITGGVRLNPDENNLIVDAGAYEGVISSSEDLAPYDIEMTAYPTLTKNRVTLTFANSKIGEVRVMVFNQDGQLVMEKKEQKGAETFKRVYDVSNLHPGSYFVRTITGNGVAGGRFLVIE